MGATLVLATIWCQPETQSDDARPLARVTRTTSLNPRSSCQSYIPAPTAPQTCARPTSPNTVSYNDVSPRTVRVDRPGGWGSVGEQEPAWLGRVGGYRIAWLDQL